MKFFSKKHQEEAICPSCGKWKTTDFTPEELQEKEWECSDCANKRLTNPAELPENRGSKEVTRYDPEYQALVRLVKLLGQEGVPPQEMQALTKAHPFETVADVEYLFTQLWNLATQKYQIPSEYLISKLPKNASKKANNTYDEEWQAQKETEDMIDHAPGYLAYDYGQDKTADGEFKGSEFSGTDDAPNPLTDIGPWSSPEDHGKKPQKSPFPNTNWLPADDQNLDQQAPSNVAASLNKKAYDEGFWIDPNGKVYKVRNSESGFITHDEWISENRDMLLNDYGIEITDDILSNLDVKEINNILIEQGWTRIGDSGNADVGIRTKDLHRIPQIVEDTLYSFYNGGKIALEDLMGKHVEINKLDEDLQKAVNHSLVRSASLNKEALQQQDVVDFYLLSLLPAQYLNQEVSPDHYDALTIFKGIIESLRNEYIERGMAELVDEAETTAWTKAIPESDMPEQIKKYYTFHDDPFPGRNYHGDSDNEDNGDNFQYGCSSCGVGLNEDDVFFFKDEQYCESCEYEAIMNLIKEEVAYCKTHNVFLTDDRDLIEYLGGKKVDDWDKHHDNGVCEVVRYDEGQKIWKEVEENAKKQLHLQFEKRKKRREEKQPKQLKLRPEDQESNEYPFPGPSPTASLKQAGEGRYGNDEGWWEAPTDFSDYTAQDFYTIFEYAPWKHMYGGPLWAEIAKTIYQMQQTTDWQKLVVLIDHYHDLGHNSGKLLDKFPEWHKWFKNLLDQKAKKNSLRYLLPRASKPVQNLVTDFLRVHGRDWREDENKGSKPESEGRYAEGESVLFHGIPAEITGVGENSSSPSYFIKFQDGSTRWAWEVDLQDMPSASTSSLNRPFSKKANPTTRYWISPDGTEFPVAGIHPVWIKNNPKILKSYGIDTKGKNYGDIHGEMIDKGWVRISNEPAGSGFQIEVKNIGKIPPFVDDFIARHFTEGDKILIGAASQGGAEITEPFPSIQKAVNRYYGWAKGASLKQADLSGQIVNTILENIEQSGGVTYNLSKGNLGDSDNYAVSIFPQNERIIDGPIDFDTLEGYLLENQGLLQDPNNSFGAWTNGSKVYLDVVVTTPDQDQALQLARQNNQIAIWDLRNNKEILTGGTGGGNMQATLFSKKNLIKTAEESLLSQPDQNEIAAASSPAYVIAVNNYAEALKRGHSKDRSLEYAIESVQNLEKVDPKKLVEFINTYVP